MGSHDASGQVARGGYCCNCRKCPSCIRSTPSAEPVRPAPEPTEEAATPEPSVAPLPDVETFEPTFGLGYAPASAAANLGGYIDSAVIQTRVRIRYDNFQNSDFPTRAEYLYPTPNGRGGPGPIGGGGGGGGGGLAGEVDLQELSTYFELALRPRLSLFAEFPVRWVSDVDISQTQNAVFDDGLQAGFSDIRVGARYAIIACEDTWLTAQVRAWAPTADSTRGLGTGHSSIDASLLYQTPLNHQWTFFGEIQDWQTLDAYRIQNADDPTLNGQALDGNVLRYGAGLSRDLWTNCNSGCPDRRLSFVFELVGWTVLDGFKTDLSGQVDPVSAEGDTIINGKYGLRFRSGVNSVYVGYGHPWSDNKWYGNLLRVELARNF